MKEQFVPYEIALKLKEKGFNELCFGDYFHFEGDNEPILNYDEDRERIITDNEDENITKYLAPLWQQVIDWLEDNFSYHIAIYPIREFWEGYIRRITGKVNSSFYRLPEATYSSRKDAQYALINEALKHISEPSEDSSKALEYAIQHAITLHIK